MTIFGSRFEYLLHKCKSELPVNNGHNLEAPRVAVVNKFNCEDIFERLLLTFFKKRSMFFSLNVYNVAVYAFKIGIPLTNYFAGKCWLNNLNLVIGLRRLLETIL